MEEVFTEIYRTNEWRYGSGGGSAFNNSILYCGVVEDYIRSHRTRSVLEIGCGDWQVSRRIDWGESSYLGIDIVPTVVERNREIYEQGDVRFSAGDVIDMCLPFADLVLAKDVFQHWSNATIENMLIRLSKFPAVIITNTTRMAFGPAVNASSDVDIEDGSFRPLDLRMHPFALACDELLAYDTTYPAIAPIPYLEENGLTEVIVDTKTVLLWTPSTYSRSDQSKVAFVGEERSKNRQ